MSNNRIQFRYTTRGLLLSVFSLFYQHLSFLFYILATSNSTEDMCLLHDLTLPSDFDNPPKLQAAVARGPHGGQ